MNLDEAQRQIGIHTEYSIMSARSAYGTGYCDGGGDISVYAGYGEDGDEASAGHTRRTGRNVGTTDSGGRRQEATVLDEGFVFESEASDNNNSGYA